MNMVAQRLPEFDISIGESLDSRCKAFLSSLVKNGYAEPL